MLSGAYATELADISTMRKQTSKRGRASSERSGAGEGLTRATYVAFAGAGVVVNAGVALWTAAVRGGVVSAAAAGIRGGATSVRGWIVSSAGIASAAFIGSGAPGVSGITNDAVVISGVVDASGANRSACLGA